MESLEFRASLATAFYFGIQTEETKKSKGSFGRVNAANTPASANDSAQWTQSQQTSRHRAVNERNGITQMDKKNDRNTMSASTSTQDLLHMDMGPTTTLGEVINVLSSLQDFSGI